MMGTFTHCPSCGAPAQGQFCGYCGTPLFTSGDVVNDMRGKRCHIWFENDDGTIECLDAFVHSVDFQQEITTLYANDMPVMDIVSQRNLTIEAELMDFDMDDWKRVVEWQGNRWRDSHGDS